MMNLLLDFPYQRREDTVSPEFVDVKCDAQAPPASTAAVPRRVSFAALSTLTITEPPDDNTWYSKRERDCQKLTLLRDARRVAGIIGTLSSKNPSALNPEKVCRCLGLEKFVSKEAHQLMQRRRDDHIRAVLVAQAWMRSHRINDHEELARFSRKSSARARRCARENAARFWAVK